MATKASAITPYLAHPVYLDVSMMVSFLAALDDGVAYTSEVAERVVSSKEREGEGALRAGLPSLAQWLGLSISAEGKYRRRSSDDESVEAKLVREHTSASLFNILRQRLLATNRAKRIETSADLPSVEVGDLVEVRGTIAGDPLRRFLALMAAVAPYMGWEADPDVAVGPTKPTGAGKGRRPSSVPSRITSTADEGLDTKSIYRILMADVAKSKVVDLSLTLDSGENVILTASNEYITDAAVEYMLAGSFTALGKVTQILGAGDSVSLLRRTVFNVLDASGQSTTADAFGGLASMMPGMDFSTLEVTGPGLQVLPLAIFV